MNTTCQTLLEIARDLTEAQFELWDMADLDAACEDFGSESNLSREIDKFRWMVEERLGVKVDKADW